ncbi:MAG: hypothetical protein RL368_2219 [Pseudomonadota bacterium]|jgi:antitoxin CptB
MSEFSRLKWHCRRGMKELDVMLTRYLEEYYPNASETEQATFRELLDLSDPLMYAYFLGYETPSNPELMALIEKIRGFFKL